MPPPPINMPPPPMVHRVITTNPTTAAQVTMLARSGFSGPQIANMMRSTWQAASPMAYSFFETIRRNPREAAALVSSTAAVSGLTVTEIGGTVLTGAVMVEVGIYLAFAVLVLWIVYMGVNEFSKYRNQGGGGSAFSSQDAALLASLLNHPVYGPIGHMKSGTIPAGIAEPRTA